MDADEPPLRKVDRDFPLSATCSQCGAVDATLKVNHRRQRRGACGAEHDRDVHAAKNIEAEVLEALKCKRSPHRRQHPEVTGDVRASGGEGPRAPRPYQRESPRRQMRRLERRELNARAGMPNIAGQGREGRARRAPRRTPCSPRNGCPAAR